MNNLQEKLNKLIVSVTAFSLVFLSTPLSTLAADSNVQEVTITNITDGSSFNTNTIPSYVEGIAADSKGLNQNSVKYYLQRDDTKKYWDGSSWVDSYQLSALNAEVSGEGSVKWISNANFPTSWDEGKYFVTAKETNKLGDFKESQTVTFNYDNTTPSNISLSINDGATSTTNKNVTLKLTYDADVYEMRISNNTQFTREPWGLADTEIKNWQLTDESGPKTVYAQFRDRSGNTSEIISASINYQFVIAPSNLKTEAKDSAVKLSWNQVSGVDHYDIQYRKTSDNNYTYVPVIKSNETEIINLTNNTEYEFQVRAVDSFGNMSSYASVNCTPQKPVISYTTNTNTFTSQTTSTNTYFDSSVYTNTTDTNTNTDTTDSEKTTTENNEEEAVISNEAAKTEEKTEGQTESARTAVTIGIIIIAIGAALGGYYGYQWWMSADEEEESSKKEESKKDDKENKNEKKEEPKKPVKENKPKKNKQNRRW